MKTRYSCVDGEMREDKEGEWVKYVAPRVKSNGDMGAKNLAVYFAKKFREKKGFDPTINFGSWIKIMKRFIDDADAETVQTVIDAFFAYPKRMRFGIYDFQRHYDDVYGFLHKQKYGER